MKSERADGVEAGIRAIALIGNRGETAVMIIAVMTHGVDTQKRNPDQADEQEKA